MLSWEVREKGFYFYLIMLGGAKSKSAALPCLREYRELTHRNKSVKYNAWHCIRPLQTNIVVRHVTRVHPVQLNAQRAHVSVELVRAQSITLLVFRQLPIFFYVQSSWRVL